MQLIYVTYSYRLRVGHAVFETQTKLSGGRSPVWNRTVHAYLPNGVESIYIQIFDEVGALIIFSWFQALLRTSKTNFDHDFVGFGTF